MATILNRTDRTTEKKIIEVLEHHSNSLAEEVRELMFVFEDIVLLDNKSIQRVLREIDTKDLSLALKGSNDDVKNVIFSNMSERAQTMLADDMEYMGPVRAKDVQESQTKIVSIIRRLEEAGEIMIRRGGSEDEYID